MSTDSALKRIEKKLSKLIDQENEMDPRRGPAGHLT